MNIPLSDTVNLQYNNGFWGIEYQVAINRDHHLAKNSTKTIVDEIGDLSKIIPVLNRYDVDPQRYNTLRDTYINILKDFKRADVYPFTSPVSWTLKQKSHEHTVKTNKNHFGFLINLLCKSDHQRSNNGVVPEVFTANSHKHAAEVLLNKCLVNDMTVSTFDEFIDVMKLTSMAIVDGMNTAESLK